MRSFKVRNDAGDTFDVEENKIGDAEKDGFLPVVTNGKEQHRVSFGDLGHAVKDGYKPLSNSDVGQVESGLRGLAQGVSFGFSDELTGAAESLFTDKTYEQSRDESRNAYEEAQEANPITYGAGEVGGAIGTAFIPGLGALNAAKGAKLATVAGKAALQGGLAGAGLSTEDSALGIAKDTAMGAALGGVAGAAGEKILKPALGLAGKGLSKAAKYADETLPKHMGKFLAGVPEEYTERYLKNPNAVNSAMSKEELAESLLDEGGAMQQLQEKLSALDAIAWTELDTTPNIKKVDFIDGIYEKIKKEILNPYDDLSRTRGSGGSLRKMQAIEKEMDDIVKAYGDDISEADIKAIVQDLQKIAYADAGSSRTSVGSEGVRKLAHEFNIHLEPIAEYDKAMGPVRENTKLLKNLERNFVNKQDPQGYDKFLGKLNRWNSRSGGDSAKQGIQDLDRVTGMGLGEDIENILAKQAFEKGDINGSRKTLGGSIVGGAVGSLFGGPVGGLVGGAAGAVAGQVADRYAGQAFKGLLDGKLAADQALKIVGPHLGKFAKTLGDAAKRGNHALAATHFILQQQDPEYRKVTKALQEQDDGNQ